MGPGPGRTRSKAETGLGTFTCQVAMWKQNSEMVGVWSEDLLSQQNTFVGQPALL